MPRLQPHLRAAALTFCFSSRSLPRLRMQTTGSTVDSSAETELSFAEEQLWLAHRASPAALPFADCAAGLSMVVRLDNALNREALQNSLTEIVRRHDVLRSRFVVRDGRPMRVCGPPAGIRLTTIDLRAISNGDRFAAAQRVLARHVNRRFDLASGRLLHADLVRLADDEHILAITAHHIVFDRWSRRVLAAELEQLYDAYAAGARPSSSRCRPSTATTCSGNVSGSRARSAAS